MEHPVCETPITGEYIAKHLKEALGPHAILKSYEGKRIAVGQGFVSHILLLKLKWEQEDHLPKSIIVKVPVVESLHKLMETMTLAAGEGEKLQVMMGQVVTEVHKTECVLYNMLGKAPPVAMPKYYVALPVTEHAPGMIILEDLSEKASVGPRWVDGLTYEQTVAAVLEVAKLHAWSLTTSVDWRSKFPVFKDYEKIFRGFMSSTREGYNVAKETYPDLFGSIDVDKLAKAISYEAMEKLMSEHLEFMEDVLIHGDCHMNNVMYEKHADGTVGDKLVALIDFQAMMKGSPAYDIARLLVFSLSNEIRRKHYDEIIQKYYNEFKKLAGDKLIATYDQMRHLIDRHYAFAALMLLSSIATMKAVLIKSEGEQREKDDKTVMANIKANYDDALKIWSL